MDRGREQQLQTAGIVWERCGAIESLPRDNRAAVALRLKQQQELVDDAVRELAEEYEAYKRDYADGDGDGDGSDGDDDDDDEWDEEAAGKIPAVLGLCRATSKALQKTRTGVVPLVDEEDPENVALLDDLLESAGQLSAHTDDLVAASYAPQDAEAVSHAAMQLASAGIPYYSTCWCIGHYAHCAHGGRDDIISGLFARSRDAAGKGTGRGGVRGGRTRDRRRAGVPGARSRTQSRQAPPIGDLKVAGPIKPFVYIVYVRAAIRQMGASPGDEVLFTARAAFHLYQCCGKW
jgi:hypothetical protein